jgi:ureidoacrylate peracid hydrolase
MICDPALVVIDMQNDYCKPGYRDTEDVHNVDSLFESVEEFLDRYRSSGRTPILVRTVHDGHVDSSTWDDRYSRTNSEKPCKPGTEGSEFIDELNRSDADVVVEKNRYDAFYNTNLETYLSSNDISTVLFMGVSTNVCVESSVRSAFNRGYRTIVLEDCVGARSEANHDHALRNIDQFFGETKSSDDIRLEPIKRSSPVSG